MFRKIESVATTFFMLCMAFAVLAVAIGYLSKEPQKCTGHEVMNDSLEFIL